MPKQRYERREPTHEWSQIRPLLKDPTQIQYEILRPIVLFGVSPKERAEETGISKSSLYAKANLFDQAGMASLLPPVPPPEIPKQDKRTLPPPMRQAIVDAKAKHPGLSLHEIARMCYVQFNRKPSHHTIQLVLANGPKPSRTTRRFPRFDEIADPAERRRVIIRLHADGWMPQSIAEYLGTSRQTVHTTLRRWAEEQFAGLEDKPHTRKRRALKTDLKAMNAVKRLQENPELGAYRIHTALLQQGINLSPRTCGRILALNRKLYHLQMPVKRGRPKKEMPFKAVRRHQYWTTDIRYLDMHQLGGGMIYCISILENFSRAILASAISRQQDTEAYLAVLYAAIRKHGVPEVLVSDNGGVFRSHDAMRIYEALGIQKVEIEKRQAWQSYIESNFNAQRRLADWHFERAQTWEDLLAAHEKWLLDFNYQHHFAHEQREDGCHSPAEVLGWVKGMQPEPERIYRAFSAVGEMRTITKAGYVRFRDYLLYGEQNLAGERALVNLFQDVLTLEYQEQPLSRYSIEWQPDEKHLRRVGNPRLYNHPYQSAQLELWPTGSVEWYLILRAQPYGSRRKRKHFNLRDDPLRAGFFERDVRTQSYLMRDDTGIYRFAHKSFLEYFVACKMTSVLFGAGRDVEQAIEFWKSRPLTHELRGFLVDMVDKSAPLWQLLEVTRNKSLADAGYAGGNAATLLQLRDNSFVQADLSQTNLAGADLSNSDLTGVNMRYAYLRQANLRGCTLVGADIRNADLTNVRLGEMGSVEAVMFDPSGEFIASGSADGIVRLWRWETGEQVGRFFGGSCVTSVCFSPDGQWVLAGVGQHGHIKVWNW